MTTNRQVRSFFNQVSKKELGKSFKSLTSKEQSLIRKKAIRIAFGKKK